MDLTFYKNRKILITGHTGFKGAWMCQILKLLDAEITGYALESPTDPSLFNLCNLSNDIHSVIGDVRDLEKMQEIFQKFQPEIVIHMAAQPIVRESYKDPHGTYETNVMGTVNVLECIRRTESVRSFVNVTTDKVYKNKEWDWGYRENEELNGYDPYSNSKSCSELITECYKNSFFTDGRVALSTCRAGNVIGGGDFAADRIIPDCIRAIEDGKDIVVRNPYSIRPYQHVLEPVMAYLMVATAQYENHKLAGNYNIGPDENDCWTTADLVSEFCSEWGRQAGTRVKWINQCDNGPHEANFLKLDCSRLKRTFGWKSTWDVQTAIEKIVEWTLEYENQGKISECVIEQIQEFMNA